MDMRKKNTIRHNESMLHRIIKESVRKTVNEVSDNVRKSFISAGKKAKKYNEDSFDLLSDRLELMTT